MERNPRVVSYGEIQSGICLCWVCTSFLHLSDYLWTFWKGCHSVFIIWLPGTGLTFGAAMAEDDGSCPLPKVIGASWRHQEILEERNNKKYSALWDFTGLDACDIKCLTLKVKWNMILCLTLARLSYNQNLWIFKWALISWERGRFLTQIAGQKTALGRCCLMPTPQSIFLRKCISYIYVHINVHG